MILYGSEVSLKIKRGLKKKIDKIISNNKCLPKLAVVLVGDNPASLSYIKGKRKACEEVGILFDLRTLDKSSTSKDVIDTIELLNSDESVDGILVQLPLPKGLDEKDILEHIDPNKDVDGLTAINAGKLFLGEKTYVPCTPLGIMVLLEEAGVDLCGKNVVVIGRSNLVGLPVSRLLIASNATVTLCHSKTKDLKGVASKADILIVAIGKDRFIDDKYVKDGAVVIDVGINRIDGKLYGDVDFNKVKDKASVITPVPKGVGPMTIAMLLHNVINAYEVKNDREL